MHLLTQPQKPIRQTEFRNELVGLLWTYSLQELKAILRDFRCRVNA